MLFRREERASAKVLRDYVTRTRTNFIRKVCPKEGTRVRVLGVYHNTAWYGAVGH